MSSTMHCNETCCWWGDDGQIMCFTDYNYTDRCNLTTTPPYVLGVRWTYTAIITIMGFFGNLTIIIILFKNRLLLRTSVNRFILNMAFADFILTCLGPVPFTIKNTHQFYVLGKTWCRLDGYIQILVMVVSTLSLAVISCDRMLGIVRPFHSHLKMWQCDIIIALIWVASAAFAIPFMVYRVYTVRLWHDLTETNCGENFSKMKPWWIFIVVVLIWIPMAVIVISYSSILMYIKFSKWRPRNSEHPAILHLKQRVIRMIFIVVVGFIVCWGPFQGCRIYYYVKTDNGRFKDPAVEEAYSTWNRISQYLLYVNPAFNPVVYGLMHRTFQRAFKITFSCFFHKKSPFVLTRGQGNQRYVWSLKSTSAAYGHCLEPSVRKKLRSKKSRTPTAVLSSSVTVAAIALDPFRNSHQSSNGCSSVEEKQEANASEDKNAINKVIPKRTSLSYVNEGFVRDLPPQRARIVSSTGALGHLITEVIEEETSSDFDSERIL